MAQRFLLLPWISLAVLAATASAARADERTARSFAALHYSTPSGTSCPDERALRERVATRLGYDPFVEESKARVDAEVSSSGRRLRGLVRYEDEHGTLKGEKTLVSERADCNELVASMALTISILLDPQSFGRPDAAETKPAEKEPNPFDLPPAEGAVDDAADGHRSSKNASSGAARPHDAPPANPLRVHVGAGASGAIGSAPAPSFGVLAFGGIATARWSLDLELRSDFPASKTRPDGTGVRSNLLFGSVVPCLRFGIVSGCGLASLGAIRGEGLGVGTPDRASAFFAALGARVALSIPIASHLEARLHLDALAPLTRTSLRLRGAPAWTTPPLSGAAGAALVGTFP